MVIDFVSEPTELDYFVYKSDSILKIGDLHSTKNYLYDLLLEKGKSCKIVVDKMISDKVDNDLINAFIDIKSLTYPECKLIEKKDSGNKTKKSGKIGLNKKDEADYPNNIRQFLRDIISFYKLEE